jgi:hypothetical protein
MSVHEVIMKLVLNINTVTQSVKYISIKIITAGDQSHFLASHLAISLHQNQENEK